MGSYVNLKTEILKQGAEVPGFHMVEVASCYSCVQLNKLQGNWICQKHKIDFGSSGNDMAEELMALGRAYTFICDDFECMDLEKA